MTETVYTSQNEPIEHDFDADLADLHEDAVRARVRSLLGLSDRPGTKRSILTGTSL